MVEHGLSIWIVFLCLFVTPFAAMQPSRLDRLEQALRQTQIELASTKHELMETQQRLDHVESSKAKDKRLDVSPMIAFHAQASPHQRNLAIHQIVIFHNVTENIGQGYDPTTGVFTCIVPGLYYFTMTIMTDPNSQVETELVMNGNMRMVVYSGGYHYWNTGSNAVVMDLNEGDKVWVRVLQNYVNAGSTTHMIHGDQWTTLTGFLLKPSVI